MAKSSQSQPDIFRDERIRQVVVRYREFLTEEKAPEIEQITEKLPDLMPNLQRELNKVRMIHTAMQQASASNALSSPERAGVNEESAPDTTSQASLDTHSQPSLAPRIIDDGIPVGELIPEEEIIPIGEIVSAAELSDEPSPPPPKPSAVRPPSLRKKPKILPPDDLRMFGHYELLEELGRGGMGVVYKAHQLSLNRTVALKMILKGELANEAEIQRFQAEAEAAAKISHPNIVQVFEIGEEKGHHYIAMEYIDGRSLADVARGADMPARKAAEYVLKLAKAMARAHEQGVIHRDLKPANILIDRDDEPHVSDFGLAKQFDSGESLTKTGQTLGTPSYMPPEQALGQKKRIGPTTDVYALGAILYTLLTGQPPYKEENTTATLMKVIAGDLTAPSKLRRYLHKKLEAICLKCLQKEPDKRYATAQQLADALQDYLAGHKKPNLIGICAKPIIRVLRQRPSKSSRAAVALVLLSIVALVLLCVVVLLLLLPSSPEDPNVLVNSIGMELRLIPAGEFMMGSSQSAAELRRLFDSSSGSFEHELPQHRVRISRDFYVGATEVTQGQWKAIMGTSPWAGKSFVKDGTDYPATYVSWDDAVEFCRRLSAKEGVTYRLPTEAEWEYACRAGSRTMYCFGDVATRLGDYAWFHDNAQAINESYAHRVRTKRPNAWGLYDMHGNVDEWCSDWYQYYAGARLTDPVGPTTGSFRVHRGGGWFEAPEFCRSACRVRFASLDRSYCLGFRVTCSSTQ